MRGSPEKVLPSIRHPWIKVCGVRTLGDLEACASAGATHAGFNTWPGSPRHVKADQVSGLVEVARRLGLVPVVLSVPGSLLPAREASRLGVWVQCAAKVLPEEREGALGLIEGRPARSESISDPPWGDVLLLDAHVEGLPGGTGNAVDFDLALRAPSPFVLAGGLTPDTVAAAVYSVAPVGVDAASGLESAPGVKDPGRIRAFCAAAREAFLNLKEPQRHRGTEEESLPR